MKLQPELLLHPNLPKPCHSLNPRQIKGQSWWEEVRQIAYKKNDYHCWACGIHKSAVKYHQWLEAHEIYKIDYQFGEVKFIDVCALCFSCHNFIHSGRLVSLYRSGEITKDKITDILEHGFKVLIDNKLALNPFALKVYKEVSPAKSAALIYSKHKIHKYGPIGAKWEDYHLLLDNKKYYGKFKNIEEWTSFYKK